MPFLTHFAKPFGIDIFCIHKKFLVFNLVGRNLKIKYRRSVLGVLWTLLSPLSLVLVFYFAFKVVMRVQMPHYLAFLVSGVVPWAFFAQSVMEGLESLVANAGVIGKVPVPTQVFPFVTSLTNFMTLLFAFPVLLGVSLITGVPLGLSLILLPLYLIAMFLICYSYSLILGLAYVYLRDLKHLTGILLQLWMYATPVVYDSSMVPEKYRWVLVANPVGGCFIAFHSILGKGEWPPVATLWQTGVWVIVSVAAMLWVQRSVGNGVAEHL